MNGEITVVPHLARVERRQQVGTPGGTQARTNFKIPEALPPSPFRIPGERTEPPKTTGAEFAGSKQRGENA